MTRRLTLAEPTGDVSVQPGAVRFAPATRGRTGVDVGGHVRVGRDSPTVGRVDEDCPRLEDGVVLVGKDVRRNVDADIGSSVAVTPITPDNATRLTVAPVNDLSLQGQGDALARALAGRALARGDIVEMSLFGGSIVVSVTVLDIEPNDPAVVTEETDVAVNTADTRDTGREPTVPSVSPSEIGGLKAERADLRRLVAGPLSGENEYGSLGVRSPAGVLVYGPSGTGKSTLVRSVAADADLPILEVTPEDCERRETLATVVDDAIENTPALIFVENLVAAAPNPDRTGQRQSESAVGWLLDTVRGLDDVIVVGEATDVDAFEPGLRRGGRFDAEVRLGVPDESGRRDVLAAQAANLGRDPDVDLDGIAARTHGYTPADLEAVLVDAATRAHERSESDGRPAVQSVDIDRALETVQPTTLRDVRIERPSLSYDDIGGLADAKRTVIRTVEWPLQHPDLFDRLAVDAPSGLLLSGPPGTGKTMLAKAVAHSTDANFLSVDGPELMNRYVGESERGVREVFERARRISPSVVFLDELDAIASERRETDTGAAERVVSQLLTELDGLSGRGQVAVLAATNRPDAIDPALLRPGRIEKRVAVPSPDVDARAEIFSIHLADVPTGRIDTSALARETAGYTGSDIAGVVREAALRAMEDHLRTKGTDGSLGALVVTQQHLEDAIDRTEPSLDVDAADDPSHGADLP